VRPKTSFGYPETARSFATSKPATRGLVCGGYGRAIRGLDGFAIADRQQSGSVRVVAARWA
jgi:hypothetical protein